MPFRINHLPKHRAWLERHLADVRGDGAYRLARKVEVTLREGNRADRLRGVDRFGRPLAALRSERKGFYGGATGTPLDPFDESSDCVKGFFARLSKNGIGWIVKVGIASEKAHIFVFHALGKVKGAPRRDILGVAPGTKAAVRKVFAAWASGLFSGRR